MNKYRDKSDFEINLCVAQIIFTDSEYDVIKQSMEVVKFQNGGGKGICHVFDPCNNPADAMPIVFENGISLIKEDDHYIAASTDVGVEGYIGSPELMLYGLGWLSKDKNLYRAAMICFLMMKDAENES